VEAEKPDGAVDAVKTTARLLRQQVAYLTAADRFRNDVKPHYVALEAAVKNTGLTAVAVCERLSVIRRQVSDIVAVYPIAGLYNHLGVLAMACRQGDQALALLYNGLTVDSEHLPIYESLGYALWIVNNDSATAHAIAARGVAVSEQERDALQAELDETRRSYQQLRLRRPDRAIAIAERLEQIETRVNDVQKVWDRFLKAMTMRLTLNYAYFGALDLSHEAQSLRSMTELYKSDPQDAEFQETMGFVRMRFAKSPIDLDDAERLFTLAVNNPRAERITTRLASAHLASLRSWRKALQGKEEILSGANH